MFVRSTLYARVEKLRRVDWARIVGGAKSCGAGDDLGAERLTGLLEAGHRVLDRAQADDGVRDPDGQRRDQLRQAVAEISVLLADARGDGNAGAQLDALGLQAAGVHPLADRAGGDGQHDVVDGSAEDVLDALEVVQLRTHERDAPVRADLDVERGRRGGAQHASSRSRRRPAPRARRRRRSPSAPAARSGSSPRSRRVPLTDIAAQLGLARLGLGDPGARAAGRSRRRRRDVEQRGRDVHAADAVDDAVVRLRQDREAVVLRAPRSASSSQSGFARSSRCE